MPILVVLVRDPRGKFEDKYLFTTDRECRLELGDCGVLAKMVDRGRLQIEQAGDEDSSPATLVPGERGEAVAVGVVDAERDRPVVLSPRAANCPRAQAARRRFGEWDTEWSLAHMLRILRAAILEATINPESATKADLCQLLDDLENYLNLAA